MGMFDSYYAPLSCQECGEKFPDGFEFQGKSLHCLMTEYKFGEPMEGQKSVFGTPAPRSSIDSFELYGACPSCKEWNDFTGYAEDGVWFKVVGSDNDIKLELSEKEIIKLLAKALIKERKIRYQLVDSFEKSATLLTYIGPREVKDYISIPEVMRKFFRPRKIVAHHKLIARKKRRNQSGGIFELAGAATPGRMVLKKWDKDHGIMPEHKKREEEK